MNVECDPLKFLLPSSFSFIPPLMHFSQTKNFYRHWSENCNAMEAKVTAFQSIFSTIWIDEGIIISFFQKKGNKNDWWAFFLSLNLP